MIHTHQLAQLSLLIYHLDPSIDANTQQKAKEKLATLGYQLADINANQQSEVLKPPAGDTKSGLLMQPFRCLRTNDIVCAIAGSNLSHILKYVNEWTNHITGTIDNQFKEAMDYSAQMILSVTKDDDKNNSRTAISFTGHSLGGSIAQVLSHTFDKKGISFDAPPSGAIIEGHAYRKKIADLKGKYPRPCIIKAQLSSTKQFINITEHGSMVSYGNQQGLATFLASVGCSLGPATCPTGLFLSKVMSTDYVGIEQEVHLSDSINPITQHKIENFVKFYQLLNQLDIPAHTIKAQPKRKKMMQLVREFISYEKRPDGWYKISPTTSLRREKAQSSKRKTASQAVKITDSQSNTALDILQTIHRNNSSD